MNHTEYMQLFESNVRVAVEAAKRGVAVIEKLPPVTTLPKKYVKAYAVAGRYSAFTVSGLAELLDTSRQNAAQMVKAWNRLDMVKRVGLCGRKQLWSVTGSSPVSLALRAVDE